MQDFLSVYFLSYVHKIHPPIFSVKKLNVSGVGGLVVSMLASGTQVRGFKPGRRRRIFRAKKSS
jgi:hypothetical protein